MEQKLIAAQTGTDWRKIVLKKWYTSYKDHIKLSDYEIHNGMSLELYYVCRHPVFVGYTPLTQYRVEERRWKCRRVVFPVTLNTRSLVEGRVKKEM
jgi:hypothetical protein